MRPEMTIRTNYKIVETEEGFEIIKFEGLKEIGLMGIAKTRIQAIAIARRLMDGRFRNDWA